MLPFDELPRAMPEQFLSGGVVLHSGDCLEVLAQLAENSVDSVVTDPPYHLTSIVKRFGSEDAAPARVSRPYGGGFTEANGGTGAAFARMSRGFMGKVWDGGTVAFEPATWHAVFRVLKPGGHLIACGGTRTYHRMACAIEDAGFEIRDTIAYLYGSGFPKSHDVSKGIDRRGGKEVGWFGPWLKAWREANGIKQSDVAALFPSKTGGKTGCVANWELGFNLPTPEQFNAICQRFGLPFESLEAAEREIIGQRMTGIGTGRGSTPIVGDSSNHDITAPATDAARQWQGWGTALKPACELIVLARKPLSEGTVAANVLKHGTGALNIDGCRVAVTGQRPYDEGWESDQSLCVSCAERVASTTKPITPETKASIAIKPVAPTTNGRDDLSQADIFKLDIGCSDGMRAEDTSINSNTAKSGNETTRLFQTDTKSITSTETKPTTDQKICSVCGVPITRLNTPPTRHGRNGSQPMPQDRASTARWPANVVHDGSAEVTAAFPDSNGGGDIHHRSSPKTSGVYGEFAGDDDRWAGYGDTGSAARFFFTAKADKDDRLGSKHPTVKPLDLMQWLVRLVCPKGGTVLDPFCGTGTTGEAAFREGMRAVLIEAEPEYQADIRRRMALVLAGPDERARESIKAKGLPADHGPLFAWGKQEAAE